MLEVLTESGETKEAKQRVSNILDEQKKTLRFAMSRPQIQFVLYETHSALDVENTRMVEKAMTEINKVAKLHHAALQGSLFNTSQEEKDSNEINNNENGDKEKIEPNVIPLKEVVSSDSQLSESEKENSGSLLDKVQVPDTDVFDTSSLPRLCPSQKCRNFEKEGCYLALIQRKQVIRLDDKYMIQMAEHRGLFGSNTTTASQKSKSGRPLVKKKEQKQDTVEKPRKKLRDVEFQTQSPVPELKLTASIKTISPNNHDAQSAEGTSRDPTESSRFQTLGILAQEKNNRTILGMLNSAQIRQFVSPFFKFADIGTMTTLMPPMLYYQKPKSATKSQRSNSSRPSIAMNSLTEQETMSTQRSSDGSSTSSRKRPGSRKMKAIVARLTQPTQNYLMRSLKEEPETKRQKKTALEYGQRQFRCELCKRRNE
ncbi:unnamed protein product [Acanthoscelides obtectus]|nr:unnamed protein product [Acanthoscelides obtectus]CAK1676486.1 hypothetical protein AOBTE_LOCUS30786 [Acanthoscelides obtectus]